MGNIAYVNGAYLLRSEAAVSIEDRGYQFADGVYEYIAFYNGTLLDGDLHLERLERSLKALEMDAPMSMASLRIVIRELIERNGQENGGIYLQVTRGAAKRDHVFPRNVAPVLSMTVSGSKLPKESEITDGVKVITYPDIRWLRRDIKSVSLLANILAKQEAGKQKTREAWLIEGHSITEGSVSNAYIVTKGGEVVTHHADEHILGGITREVVLRLARKAGIAVAERAFTLTEMKNASEAFLTSTSANVLPVTSIDGNPVGEGKPGKVTRKLLELYTAHIFKQTGWQA